MKTIGIDCSRRINSRCKSGPVMPGIATSRTRQFVSATDSEARNSSADENVRGSKPNSLSRSGSDSRTDSSSSTTDIRGRSVTVYASRFSLMEYGECAFQSSVSIIPWYRFPNRDQYQGIDRYLRLIDSLSHP